MGAEHRDNGSIWQMFDQWSDRLLQDVGALHVGWFSAVTGWFMGLKPLHGALIAAGAISIGSIVGYRFVESVVEAPAGLEALEAALDSTNARLVAVEASTNQSRADVQQIMTGLTQAQTTFRSMQSMVNELFCDRFPMGSPSGVRCQLTAVPIP